jgi:hypothetical protein
MPPAGCPNRRLDRAAADPTVRAIDFLASRQRVTAHSRRTAALAVPPARARPGDPAALLYVTRTTHTDLRRLRRQPVGSARRPNVAVARAAAHLASRIGSDGRLPSFLHTHGRQSSASGGQLRCRCGRLAVGLAFGCRARPTALAWLIATIPKEPVAAGLVLAVQLQEPVGMWRSGQWRPRRGDHADAIGSFDRPEALVSRTLQCGQEGPQAQLVPSQGAWLS